LGGLLGAGTGPRGGRDASRGNLGAAVHRHTLERVNAINVSLGEKKTTACPLTSLDEVFLFIQNPTAPPGQPRTKREGMLHDSCLPPNIPRSSAGMSMQA